MTDGVRKQRVSNPSASNASGPSFAFGHRVLESPGPSQVHLCHFFSASHGSEFVFLLLRDVFSFLQTSLVFGFLIPCRQVYAGCFIFAVFALLISFFELWKGLEYLPHSKTGKPCLIIYLPAQSMRYEGMKAIRYTGGWMDDIFFGKLTTKWDGK